MTANLVSVIIPTKNEQDNIANCLQSITLQNYPIEIIVVDNNSGDKTVKIAKTFTKHVYQKGNERSEQRNFGIKKTKGAYVLFIDADMELEKNIVRESVNKLQNNPKLVGIIIDEVAVGKGFLSRVKALEKKLYSKNLYLEAARFFRKADLLKIGGYDEKLISGEDWDLSQRLSKFGKFGRIKSRIHHFENQSFLEDIKKKYYYAKNIQGYTQKYPKIWNQKQANPLFRLKILLAQPRLLIENPLEFIGLILLKSAHFLAYLAAKI